MGCFLSREISAAEIQNEPSTVFNELSSLPINLQQLLKQPGEYISFNFFLRNKNSRIALLVKSNHSKSFDEG